MQINDSYLNKFLQVKCHQYWPPGNKSGGEDVMFLTDFGLKVQYISETEASYYTTRILRLVTKWFQITVE